MTADLEFMRLALELARQGTGLTSPNPLVGAVVVKEGRVIGSGFHQRAGGPHAEVLALEEAGSESRGAHLYVNLEPCCHWGKTGPCVDRILEAGIARVIISMQDPNPRVSGRSIARLREEGVEVSLGLLEDEATRLNEPFVKWILTGKPLVVLKWAMTLDGRIATEQGESRWITSEDSRREVHRLRATYDAVLVGRGTIEKDDPSLTVRLVEGRNPRRVVLDTMGRIPLGARCLTGVGETIVAVAGAPPDRVGALRGRGATVLVLPPRDGRVGWQCLLDGLASMDVTSLLVEGGAEVAASALEAGVVDKVLAFIAPRVLGGRNALGPVGGAGWRLDEARDLEISQVMPIGRDLLIEAYVKPRSVWRASIAQGESNPTTVLPRRV